MLGQKMPLQYTVVHVWPEWQLRFCTTSPKELPENIHQRPTLPRCRLANLVCCAPDLADRQWQALGLASGVQ